MAQLEVSLREYLERLISEGDTRSGMRDAALRSELEVWRLGLQEHMQLVNQATEKAATAMNHRLEGMNEFRQQLREQSGTFVVRGEFQSALEAAAAERNRIGDAQGSFITRIEMAAFAEKMDGIQSAIDQGEGRRTVNAALVALISSLLVSLAVGLIVYAVTHH